SLCNGGGMAYASLTTRQLLAVLRVWRSLRLFGIFLCRCLSGPTPAFIRPGPQPWLELAVCAGGRWRVTAARWSLCDLSFLCRSLGPGNHRITIQRRASPGYGRAPLGPLSGGSQLQPISVSPAFAGWRRRLFRLGESPSVLDRFGVRRDPDLLGAACLGGLSLALAGLFVQRQTIGRVPMARLA